MVPVTVIQVEKMLIAAGSNYSLISVKIQGMYREIGTQ